MQPLPNNPIDLMFAILKEMIELRKVSITFVTNHDRQAELYVQDSKAPQESEEFKNLNAWNRQIHRDLDDRLRLIASAIHAYADLVERHRLPESQQWEATLQELEHYWDSPRALYEYEQKRKARNSSSR